MQTRNVDYKLFFAILVLIIFWMIMISSVSVYPSFKVTSSLEMKWLLKEANNHFYVLRNIIHVFLSWILLVFFVKIHYSFFEKHAKKIFLLAIFLLILVLLIGASFWWSSRWLILPWIPFTIMPSEFLVFAFIVFLGYFLKKNYSKRDSFKDWFIPFLGILSSVVLLLAMQPNFWAIMIISTVWISMYIISKANIKYLLLLFLFWLLFSLSIYNIWKYDKNDSTSRNSFSYVTDRIDMYLANKKDLIEKKQLNYQLEQWFIAIGSWWFTGLWFGQSVQKYWYLPEVQWDFIFSVIIEELWFLGWIVLISVFSFIWYRWYYIRNHSPDLFSKLVAFWITTWILIQACINMWVNLWIVPLTWLTLPFISYWWSSLLSFTLWVGLLLNISRYINETKIIWKRNSDFKKSRIIIM